MTKEEMITRHKFETEFKIKDRYTELAINGNGIVLRCYITNKYNARNRRQLLLAVNNKVLPLFEFVRDSKIHHSHHVDDFTSFDQLKILSTKQGILIEDEQGKIGYLIRGIRSKRNQTQVQFARQLGIHPCYLSQLEKGWFLPSRRLLTKIDKMKNAPEIEYP